MLSPLRRASLAPSLRLLHSSTPRLHRIGPPDPTSHLHSSIYDTPAPTRATHPYSLSEFSGTYDKVGDHELQWRLHRQQLDLLDQEFWTDSNARFEAGKAAVLSGLAESSSPLDKEHALSEFYKTWVIQERHRMDAYTAEWRRRNFDNIVLELRFKYNRFTSRIARLFKK